jgi:hypothetical protein
LWRLRPTSSHRSDKEGHLHTSDSTSAPRSRSDRRDRAATAIGSGFQADLAPKLSSSQSSASARTSRTQLDDVFDFPKSYYVRLHRCRRKHGMICVECRALALYHAGYAIEEVSLSTRQLKIFNIWPKMMIHQPYMMVSAPSSHFWTLLFNIAIRRHSDADQALLLVARRMQRGRKC